ncbi:MAG TPA: histidine phosphatase family protein [Gemmatimonadaceae bacterium]
MLHLLSSLSFALGFTTATIDSTELRREKLMEELRKGGYTVLLRHARTDRSFNEQRDPVPQARKDQRNLTDEGIKDAALMGVVFRKNGIQFGEIISSPMYRCVETAEYSVGKPTSTTMLLRTFPTTPEQAALVMKAPKRGTNRLIVTHHFVIETHVPGIKPGDVGESEAAVVRHTADGKVVLVGRITLDDWQALANPDGARSKPAAAESRTDAAAHGGALAALGRLIHGSPDSNAKPVEVPDTHAGHIAREYITAFNSGSTDKMRAYIDAWMVPNPARTTEERLSTYAGLFAEHGPLTIVKVESSEALEVTLGMRSKRGNFRLTVKSSETQPMRAQSVTFALMEGTHR